MDYDTIETQCPDCGEIQDVIDAGDRAECRECKGSFLKYPNRT